MTDVTNEFSPNQPLNVVILAGGYGTRLSEETLVRPKPLVEIGGKPIVWHIMKVYAAQMPCRFYIAAGYMWESFIPFVDFAKADGLDITLIDTGLEKSTGGRLKALSSYLPNRTFSVTYGDGLSDINLQKEFQFHRLKNRIGTVAAVRPPARFGSLEIQNTKVTHFGEKLQSKEGWINGGFFFFENKFFDYLKDDYTPLESLPLSNLSQQGQLSAYQHFGFWKPMDTLREKTELEQLWESGNAPWKVWN